MLIIDSKYAGKYVAVDADDNIIAVSESREELLRILREKGYKQDEFGVFYVKKQGSKQSLHLQDS